MEQSDKLNAKHCLVVMSGKGGVGKTTVAVNLAQSLSLLGKKTGLLDVDLHGPNIAKMLGIESRRMQISESGIIPVEVNRNLKAVSIALSGNNPDQPIIWRGPAKSTVIRQFLEEVQWGALDYLIIDSPPGTGDEPLSVCQMAPRLDGVIIVTTPQDVAVLDARKSVLFAREIKVPVAGIIENMSGFVCPHCRKDLDIFKKGGGRKAAEDLNVPFLGSVPFCAEFVDSADRGIPFAMSSGETAGSEPFMKIVEGIRKFTGDA
ncbi:MAG: Mrp/NBP35 family ATP-binding protein [Candidatus Omnitrophica bacterium]|nr:Mrp/NBP35 family ATP-binding protein [Candidatus Omnitrophota bacterium]MDD5501163.1 Mrp/NBP35 family ATP-binding protein [Candidatus Omnitrophota bacterium]